MIQVGLTPESMLPVRLTIHCVILPPPSAASHLALFFICFLSAGPSPAPLVGCLLSLFSPFCFHSSRLHDLLPGLFKLHPTEICFCAPMASFLHLLCTLPSQDKYFSGST